MDKLPNDHDGLTTMHGNEETSNAWPPAIDGLPITTAVASVVRPSRSATFIRFIGMFLLGIPVSVGLFVVSATAGRAIYQLWPFDMSVLSKLSMDNYDVTDVVYPVVVIASLITGKRIFIARQADARVWGFYIGIIVASIGIECFFIALSYGLSHMPLF